MTESKHQKKTEDILASETSTTIEKIENEFQKDAKKIETDVKENIQAQSKVNRLGTDSIPRLIVEFAIPAIAGMLINAGYNLIDAVFLGQAVGEIGLTTTQVALPIMTVFLAIAMLVGAGGNALAALKLGQGRQDLAERTLGNTVTLSIVLSAVIAILASCPPVFDWLLTISSTTEEVRPGATIFLRIICYGYILQCIGLGVNNFIRTSGAPNRALGTMVIGAAGCIIFNYLFVMVMGLGVMGSALATIVGQGCSCISVLWYFLFTKGVPIKLKARCLKPDFPLCRSILALGLASFFVQIGAAVVNFVMNYLLVKYGAESPIGADNALASIGLVMRISWFTIVPLIGMSVAIQPILGFNYGARNFYRVRKTWLDGMLGATALAVIMFLVVQLWPRPIITVFGIADGTLMDYTVFALRISLLLLPVIGFQIVGANYFQATGQPLKSSLLSLSRQILFLVPMMFLLPEILPWMFPGRLIGLDALYIATPASDFCAFVLTLVFVLIELRRLKRIEKEEGEDALAYQSNAKNN